ncbi:MAG: hypothetical protein R2867_01700 [Caldilineaceae bacterium]
MYPMSHEYHEAQIERLAVAFAPFARPQHVMVPKLYIAGGEPIFSGHESESTAYLVTSGEVVILRSGRPVDLIEEGEIVDLALWPGTTAMALTPCTLLALTTLAPYQVS